MYNGFISVQPLILSLNMRYLFNRACDNAVTALATCTRLVTSRAEQLEYMCTLVR